MYCDNRHIDTFYRAYRSTPFLNVLKPRTDYRFTTGPSADEKHCRFSRGDVILTRFPKKWSAETGDLLMNRVTAAFEMARSSRLKLLCPFLTAGFPNSDATSEFLLAAQAGGAGVLELGIPFSDPVADGPVIQASYTEALLHGATVDNCLAAVKAARSRGLTIPVMAMVSFSIIFKRGTAAFAQACAANGVDGLVLPDLPLEEAPAIVDVLRDHGLCTALLIAPTTPADRREAIARLCDGFIYYLSVSGITGERKALPLDIAPNVAALRAVSPAPVCVGFGISTPQQVREVTRVADGAIVGSVLIRSLLDNASRGVAAQAQAVRKLVAELATGLTPLS